MEKCKPYTQFKYRLYEHYFGKFDVTSPLCDCFDKETADKLIKILSNYYKKRPFSYFLKEIVYD